MPHSIKKLLKLSYAYFQHFISIVTLNDCLLYTSDAADDMQCVDLGGRRIIKKYT